MFERFTDRARRVVVIAQTRCREMKHSAIGTEHLLLGLVECEGIGGKVLSQIGADKETTTKRIQAKAPDGEHEPQGHIPFTPRSKKVMELSLREALTLGHNYIGTEHLLLALVREGEGLGAEVVASFQEPETIRKLVIEALSGDVATPAPTVKVSQDEFAALLTLERAARARATFLERQGLVDSDLDAALQAVDRSRR